MISDRFTDELHAQMERATSFGSKFVMINSWELHYESGGLPGVDHSLPMCRVAMRKDMTAGDLMLVDNGSGLSIRYLLPRQLDT
jgi:hypothetical protein